MNTEPHEIVVQNLRVQVVRKAIKNLHLGVYPPAGRIRVAAPVAVSDDAIRLAVIDKLGWIKRQRARFGAQARQGQREMVSGESHYLLGRRYRLRVAEFQGAGHVVLRNRSILELHVRTGSRAELRQRVLERWYRERLRELIPPLVAKWGALLAVPVSHWGIKRMKTKWGSCNADARRIWLNLELVKKPIRCVDYLVLHELVHLIERRHNRRFIALMDRHMPDWRLKRKLLNSEPLSHQSWTY